MDVDEQPEQYSIPYAQGAEIFSRFGPGEVLPFRYRPPRPPVRPIQRLPRSLCILLRRREIGQFDGGTDQPAFRNTLAILADRALVNCHRVLPLRSIGEDKRSTYMIATSPNGFGIVSHSNRSLSIINTASMSVSNELQSADRRTIWVVAIHPRNATLVATGSMGGLIVVYRNSQIVCQRSEYPEEPNLRVTSLAFHPRWDLIIYTVHGHLIIWNWHTNTLVQRVEHSDMHQIKMVKFSGAENMLITGTIYNFEAHALHHYEKPFEWSAEIRHDCESVLRLILHACSEVLYNVDLYDTRLNILSNWHKMISYLKSWRDPNAGRPVRSIDTEHTATEKLHLMMTLVALSDRADQLLQRWRIAHIMATSAEEHRIADVLGLTVPLLYIVLGRYEREMGHSAAVVGRRLEYIFRRCYRLLMMFTWKREALLALREYHDPKKQHLRLQGWVLLNLRESAPNFRDDFTNVIAHGYMHSDATVSMSPCETMLASFRERKENFHQINVHSIRQQSLGQLLYTYRHCSNKLIMSLSISPSSQWLLVGTRSTTNPAFFLHFAADVGVATQQQPVQFGDDTEADAVACAKWSARAGDGALLGYRSFRVSAIVTG